MPARTANREFIGNRRAPRHVVRFRFSAPPRLPSKNFLQQSLTLSLSPFCIPHPLHHLAHSLIPRHPGIGYSLSPDQLLTHHSTSVHSQTPHGHYSKRRHKRCLTEEDTAVAAVAAMAAAVEAATREGTTTMVDVDMIRATTIHMGKPKSIAALASGARVHMFYLPHHIHSF